MFPALKLRWQMCELPLRLFHSLSYLINMYDASVSVSEREECLPFALTSCLFPVGSWWHLLSVALDSVKLLL